MSKVFGITFAAAVLLIGGAIWFGFENTKGNHLVPTGSIGKVRTVKADDALTYMVIDFKVKNDSDRDMVVHSIEASVDTDSGDSITGKSVAKSDVESAFRSYPVLGEQFNPVLRERDTVPAHQEVDRMVGIRFDGPPGKVEMRKRLVLRIDDITGAQLEMTK